MSPRDVDGSTLQAWISCSFIGSSYVCLLSLCRCNVVISESQYDDHQYIYALRLLEKDSRISSLGLCNFDTQRLEEILSAGINVVSDQVQVSG